MIYGLLADLLVVAHLGFVVFVVVGGLAVLRWPRVAWAHLPAAGWGALIEFTGWVCPLTPLEIRFREMAGETGYPGGFVEHYVVPLVYPGALTREIQVALGVAVVVVNVAVYAVVVRRRRRKERKG
ncbi:MAG: DUF2784 family protein [Gemmatimonadetes bacterium]|nr:DUF2784 domain-containing protein [Gemmatimonadota bacterium]NIR78190.1 DUF2784 domain-containing protein [Gemmatimonadota bacterium]NIT86772.1 DUF2784 domain-containing protein [Gemmatimonadota bacterium]NIU30642.1 DUF2784 domain-containing protein [Gemmatimonadota bacterium]NIU35448.1 DUF2784 family protein [Gemmatimonadota bacterium]